MKAIDRLSQWLCLVAVVLTVASCGSDPAGDEIAVSPEPDEPDDKVTVVLGFVARSQEGEASRVALAGARDAADEVGKKYGVTVDLLIRTPPAEDADAQAKAIAELERLGVEGIAVSASNVGMLRDAIRSATDVGTVVVCFEVDVPDSGRLCYYGGDEIDTGQKAMAALAKLMDEQGNIAILAGNQASLNLQKRREGVLSELTKYTEMKLVDTIHHPENPAAAGKALRRAQSTRKPVIEGWVMLGGWPLLEENAMPWDAGAVKVVAVGAMPPMLSYVDDGHVQLLLANDYYAWGYESVRLLLDKIVEDKSPDSVHVPAPLEQIRRENADAYRATFAQRVDPQQP